MHTTAVDVDLTAVERNFRTLKQILTQPDRPTPGICAILKANGYGMGAARVAKRLAILDVDLLAVNTPEQARELVEAAVSTPILLLMPVRRLARNDALYRAASRGRIHFSIHDLDNLHTLIDMTQGLGITVPVHIEVDTGMCRGGTNPAQAEQIAIRVTEHNRLRLAGVYTHLASADCDADATRRQHDLFEAWLQRMEPLIPEDCLIHEANTPGTLRSPDLARGMVRIGLGLYGYGLDEYADAREFTFAAEAEQFAPAVRLVSTVMQVKMVDEGSTVGYGGVWKAERPTRLALIPVGYADGYPLALSESGAAVGFTLQDGERAWAPVVGRISMDQLTVDITDLPREAVRVGAEVELIGTDRTAPNFLTTLAHQAGTSTYELMCGLSARLPRRYIALEEARESTDRTFALTSDGRGARRG